MSTDLSKDLPADAHVTAMCFGSGEVVLHVRDTKPETLVTPGKPLALLVYLLFAPKRTAARDRLADLLWANLDPAAARKQLRSALSLLRGLIGSWAIEGDDRGCTLSSEISADVFDFSAAVARGDALQALDLYKGDFLAGFTSPGSQEFELWAEMERAHLRSLAGRAAEMGCREALDKGRASEAWELAKRFRMIDPHSELAWRLGLEALIANGDDGMALIEASRFEAWLQAEEREPEPRSRALLELINRTTSDRDSAATQRISRVADLIGREADFGAILGAWAKGRTGKTQFVEVTGPAGLGKTRLVEDVANRLRAKRHTALYVRAHSVERDVAYAFLVTLVRGLAVLPGARAVSESSARTIVGIDPRLADDYSAKPETSALLDVVNRRSGALQELIAAVADETAVALFVDDVHWMDAYSRAVIESAFAHLTNHRLMIVLASRGSGLTISADASLTRLRLMPLSKEDVRSLIASMAEFNIDTESADEIVGVIHVAAAGNPLLVITAIEDLSSRGLLAVDNGEWRFDARLTADEAICTVNPIEARLRALRPSELAMLTACAISGAPLRREVLFRIPADADEDKHKTFLELERLGHISVSGNVVEVSHDAISEHVLARTDSALLRAIQWQLGTALAESTESRDRARGVRHLLAAGRRDDAFALLRPLVGRRRSETRESVRDIVAELVGVEPDHEIVKAAVRSLPLSMRVHRSVLAAAGVVLLSGAALAGRQIAYANKPDEPNATLEIIHRVDVMHARRVTISLDAEGWRSGRPIVARLSAVEADTLPRAYLGAFVRPGADEWAGGWQASDSGGVDVALFGSGGFIRRLTSARADEHPGSWSPDGKQIAVETSQFGDSGHKKVGILDVSTGSIRPLDAVHETQREARWSPDGTRIAFIGHANDSLYAICVSGLSGEHRFCARVHDDNTRIAGWSDDAHVLLFVEATRQLQELDTRTGQVRPTDVEVRDAPQLSPDGQWLFYRRLSAGETTQILVAPTNDFAHPRQVLLDGPKGAALDANWRGPTPLREFLDSLSIQSQSDTIGVGVPARLRVTGLSRSRRSVPVQILEWTSLDTSIATIDSAGVVRARRTGTVTIEASAGGWRKALRTFRVIESSTAVVFEEDWSRSLAPRWRPFGRPFPSVADDSLLGKALLNNGDGDYLSGVYTPEALDARHGIALDAVVRMRVTRPQWQLIQIGLIGVSDLARLSRNWDHVTGYLTSRRNFDSFGCFAEYPQGEGPTAAESMGPVGPLSRRPGARLPDIGLDIPTHIRLQVFPDGRCGVAVNGVPLFESERRIPHPDSMIVVLQGNSVATKVLVGKVSVRKGVPGDISWNALASGDRVSVDRQTVRSIRP
jgi:DNA-binding SARP family transcriptional activator